jgi:hypothetical protein
LGVFCIREEIDCDGIDVKLSGCRVLAFCLIDIG